MVCASCKEPHRCRSCRTWPEIRLAGVVALWDVNTSQPVTEYEAHEKRIWSVDFCHTDPMLFLSGSDDGWVKVCTHPFVG